MLAKANSRKHEKRKDTIFVLGGRVWTVDRIKKTTGRRKTKEVLSVASSMYATSGI
jgi:hypothetical protein